MFLPAYIIAYCPADRSILKNARSMADASTDICCIMVATPFAASNAQGVACQCRFTFFWLNFAWFGMYQRQHHLCWCIFAPGPLSHAQSAISRCAPAISCTASFVSYFSRTAEGPWPLQGKVPQDSARVLRGFHEGSTRVPGCSGAGSARVPLFLNNDMGRPQKRYSETWEQNMKRTLRDVLMLDTPNFDAGSYTFSMPRPS